jgi:hypothetical protein
MMKEEETIETNQSRINALIKTFKYSYLRHIEHFLDA